MIYPCSQDLYNLTEHLLQFHLLRTEIHRIVTYLVVLAVNALQIAMGEKNVTNALVSRNSRFFSPMDAYGRNIERCISFTIAGFGRKTVGVAIPRTNTA
jgi:hypothetical protein